jgi:putative addiction module component (TIGR02574 family)
MLRIILGLQEFLPMMDVDTITKEALALTPKKRAELVDRLLLSLDETAEAVDALWVKESEDRINAYESGRLKAVSLEDVLAKYR